MGYSPKMSTENKLRYGLDPSKYPKRMGQTWKEDEVVKLLRSIQKKKTIEEIAKEHERTVGSIHSYIRKLAIDYYINDKRPIEEIQKFTGLTKEQIEEVIKRHEYIRGIKTDTDTCLISLEPPLQREFENSEKKLVTNKKVIPAEQPTILEILSILKDIQGKLNIILEKVA